MVDWLKRWADRPGIAHLIRALTRFDARLGSQFSAAMAYFSILAIVPILMFAFAIVGYVLELRPDLLAVVKEQAITAAGGVGNDGEKIGALIDNTLSNYRAIGIVGLLAALYSGSGWVGNLKNAIRAQWRPDFDLRERKSNPVLAIVMNMLELIALLLMIAVTFGIASAATSLNDQVMIWLALPDTAAVTALLTAGPALLSVAAGWLLFMFIYWAFPEESVPMRARVLGSLWAAIALGLLQYATTALLGLFTQNPAVAIFGPVIALLLFFNLFARLTLLIAAWIATTDQAALSTNESSYSFDPLSPVHGPALPPRGLRPTLRPSSWAGTRTSAGQVATPRDGQVLWEPGAEQEFVPQKVAAQGVRIGMGAGWVTGIATGVGVGAVIAGMAAKWGRRS